VEEATGVKSLGFAEAGFRHMVTNKKGIRTVEDMAGLKIRTMENEMYVSTYKLIGANSVPMAMGEVLSGLQQGTIDGLDAPIMLIKTAKLNDLTEYLSLTGHFYNALQLIVNGDFFNKLTPEQQAMIVECGKKAAASQRENIAANELVWLKELGMETIPASEIDLTGLSSRVEEIYGTYSKEIGGTFVEDLRAAAQSVK
jgi:TRAP-type C4-dicarboxylate transport system substrate-binding protein